MTEGLQIGKIIFESLNICEWTFLLIILITSMVKRTTRKGFYLISAISIILVLETRWLLPVLDTNTDLIIERQQVTDHIGYWLYILLEIVKVSALLLIGLESGQPFFKEKTNNYN